jgi:hypothetical protein
MNKIFIAFTLSLFVFIAACGPDYNTDFEPPPPNAKLEEVFPADIEGMRSYIERINLAHPLEGFSAAYGNDKITIDAILAPDKQTADDFFKETIVPRFDKMKNHFRGNINGKWRASGTDKEGKKWFGWVNNRWIFLLSGSNKENFAKAIDAFKFISE